MEVSENPEEITTETAIYTVDWGLAKTDKRTSSWILGISEGAVKSALNRCWREMSLTRVHGTKGET